MNNQEETPKDVNNNELNKASTYHDNGQEEPAKSSGVKLPTFVVLIIYFFSIILAVGILGVISYIVCGLTGTSFTCLFLNQLIMTIATLSVTYLMMKYIDGKPFAEIGLSIAGRRRDIVWGMIAAIGINGLGFLIMLLIGAIEITSIDFNFTSLLISFIFFILVSINEEVMCRGYILRRLLDTRLNKFVALVISSLIFAVMHLLNPNVAAMPVINLIIAGILLGATYIYTRNLWFPFSLHLFWNWVQGPVLGFEVSGLDTMKGDVINITRPYSNLINGGEFGFEGSILCTLLCCITIGLIIGHYQRKKTV